VALVPQASADIDLNLHAPPVRDIIADRANVSKKRPWDGRKWTVCFPRVHAFGGDFSG